MNKKRIPPHMKPPVHPMDRKFLKGGPAAESNFAWDHFFQEYYFFYGTLMDPSKLAEVLQLPGRPELRPAKIIGYHYKLWGEYPALLDEPQGGEVHGMAYEVKSQTELDRLIAYEGEMYTLRGCLIRFKDDGSEALGNTFGWNGDQALLREGVFDLKDWQMKRLEEGG